MRKHHTPMFYPMFALLAVTSPSYSGKSPSPTPVKLECKEATMDEVKVRFVTYECANGIFYAQGPKCNEIDGECPREMYRIEIEQYGDKTILLDVDGDLRMDSAVIVEESNRIYWIENKTFLERKFRDYLAILFGSSILSNPAFHRK